MDIRFSFLGNEKGELLPLDQLADKLAAATNRFNAVSTPDEAHAVIAGMTAADIQTIFERCRINDQSTMRIFGATPLIVPKHVVRRSAVAIAESESEENPIPDDIDMMVRCHVQEALTSRMSQLPMNVI